MVEKTARGGGGGVKVMEEAMEGGEKGRQEMVERATEVVVAEEVESTGGSGGKGRVRL